MKEPAISRNPFAVTKSLRRQQQNPFAVCCPLRAAFGMAACCRPGCTSGKPATYGKAPHKYCKRVECIRHGREQGHITEERAQKRPRPAEAAQSGVPGPATGFLGEDDTPRRSSGATITEIENIYGCRLVWPPAPACSALR